MNFITQTAEFLKARGFHNPDIGIILGTGLGKLLDEVKIIEQISYNHIPHFPTATVEFHRGFLIYGELEGKTLIIMQGRFHLYEGYNFQDVSFPVRIMGALGVKRLLVSNAAGAINLQFKVGDLMLINDHINLQGGSPLAFKGVSKYGERFVDMSCPYDSEMSEMLLSIAERQNVVLHQGVYTAVIGPQLETRAEYRYLKIIGADAVGMSTVPEIIVANQLKIPVIAVSVLTDACDPDHLKPVNITEIMTAAEAAESKMIPIFRQLIKAIQI